VSAERASVIVTRLSRNEGGNPARAPGVADRATRLTRAGPASKPVLYSFVVQFCSTHNSRGSSLRRRSAGVDLLADRHTHRRKRGLNSYAGHLASGSCSAAPPTSASVTRAQSGGSPSSVEHVDVIGSSFPLTATAESSVAYWNQYLPQRNEGEPLMNCSFANALVTDVRETQSSSDWRRTRRLSASDRAPSHHLQCCAWRFRPPKRTQPHSLPDHRPASAQTSPENLRRAGTD